MRKLKLFLLLFVAAGSIYSLTACKDKDEENGSIVGTWEWEEGNEYDTFDFNANGTYRNAWCEDEAGLSHKYESGTYTYRNSNLTLTNESGHSDTYKATISGNKLRITYQRETIVYTRQ